MTLLARHQVPLIEDGVYDERYYGTRQPRPAKAWDGAGLVLHCSSFSKSLAPGFRVGWVAAARLARAVARRELMNSLAAPVPSQEGLSEYLRHGGYDRHLRGLRQTLVRQRQAMLDAVAQHFPKGTRVTQPEGGYFVWVELPPTVDALELHRLALSQQISLAPGHLFSPGNDYRHHVRLNFGHPDNARIADALKIVGRLAKALA